MKRLDITVNCMAVYNSFIDVPDDMDIDEAIKYAKEHLSDVPIPEGLEWVRYIDVLDEENSEFEDMD